MLDTLCELYFLPPMAMARVGPSETPQDSFAWEEDSDARGGCATVIRPRVSLRVLPDGSPEAFVPREIVFRDAQGIRPVAPFFELWAEVRRVDGGREHLPVTQALLDRLGIRIDALRFRVRAGNFKAARRTHDPSCGFLIDHTFAGDDHTRHRLDAFSPRLPGREPLVHETQPICLGHVQLLRPVEAEQYGVDLRPFRVRFTPGKGEVYGPVGLASAAASPLEPGRALPASSMAVAVHEVVPPDNRILNPNTPWSGYVMDTGHCDDPQPADSYDGANVDSSSSWGIVDDTCEAVIRAELVVRGERFTATARAIVAQPDYAPDRRPVFSFTDELADRDLPRVPVDDSTAAEALQELADLFARAFESASLMNLDAARDYLVRENLKRNEGAASPEAPSTGFAGMTEVDRPLARVVPHAVPASGPDRRLPMTDVARQIHAALMHAPHLLHLLRTQPDRVRKLVRPPFGRFSQLPVEPATSAQARFRDPRRFRDTLHDMRMPPYMRDSGREPLSISTRQYDALMSLLDWLETADADAPELPAASPEGLGIYPRNLTARMDYLAHGNPATTRLEDVVGNCFPGLEVDVRNLDRRFFPGLVFNFAGREHRTLPAERPELYGARLVSLEYESDPDLDPGDADARPLLAVFHSAAGHALHEGEWFLGAITQGGKTMEMVERDATGAEVPLDGMTVWRIVRGLEPGPVAIRLDRRDAPAEPLTLHGWRRVYVDPTTGVLHDVFQPGELVQSLCSPWQHDFRDCACMYWAANRPDVVFGRADDEEHKDLRLEWLRSDRGPSGAAFSGSSYYETRPHQMNHHELNSRWTELAFVLEEHEIADRYAPQDPVGDAPYASAEVLARVLREELAPLELSLSLEYLYAHFSLRGRDEIDGQRWPRLADEVEVLRRQLLMIAISEMSHLRWVNEILWGLHRAGCVATYEPVATAAARIPRSSPDDDRSWRPLQLRPCTPSVLADFVDVEMPSGFIDGAYARVVATLRQPEYPRGLYALAVRIDSDGIDHYRRFSRSAGTLARYPDEAGRWPYLRPLRRGTPEQCAEAIGLYEEILASVKQGFATAAEGDFGDAQGHQLCSRDLMERLQVVAEALARQGVGVPFAGVSPC